MLEIKANKDDVSIKGSGNILDALAEAATIINSLSSFFKKHGGIAAEQYFRELVKKWVSGDFE